MLERVAGSANKRKKVPIFRLDLEQYPFSRTKIEHLNPKSREKFRLFDKEEFREADAILKAEEMGDDLDRLIKRDEELEREQAEVRQGREQIANEFLIKARL